MTTLYSFKPSSSSWRVRAALYHKKLWEETTVVEVSLLNKENEEEEFKKINPLKQVPCLIINENVLTQSLPIIEYLDAIHNSEESCLIPKDALLAYEVREIAEIINSGIQPLHTGSVMKMLPEEKRKEWMDFWVRKGLAAIETILAANYPIEQPLEEYKYCVPQYQQLSLADICLVPQVFVAKTRTGIDVETEFPTISRVYSNLIKMDAFAKTHPQAQ